MRQSVLGLLLFFIWTGCASAEPVSDEAAAIATAKTLCEVDAKVRVRWAAIRDGDKWSVVAWLADSKATNPAHYQVDFPVSGPVSTTQCAFFHAVDF